MAADRILSPARADKKIDRFYVHRIGLQSMGDVFLSAIFLSFVSSMIVVPLAIFVSPYLLSVYSALIVYTVLGATVIARSHKGKTYSNDRSLYGNSYHVYKSIADTDSRSEAKTLLNNVYRHEEAMKELGKPHDGSYHCVDCHDRYLLINQIKVNQPTFELDRSDIEAVEARMAARKELGV